jgi:predicted amidohydrolase
MTPPVGVLRVAAAQGESVSGDVEANVATAVALVEQAADAGARVVVLPELFLTGYDPDGWSRETSVAEMGDDRLEPLSVVCSARSVVLVVGAAVASYRHRNYLPGRPPRPVRLSLLVVDSAGTVQVAYVKQHLTDEEKTFFAPGKDGASIVVDGWELGLGVCYDGCFPEHAATAAAEGASAYLCPSAYYIGSEHRRDLYYAARALDNGMYVVFSGLTGNCGSYKFNGGSAVYDPEGRPLTRAGDESPAVVVADLDPAEIVRVRAMNPIGRDRREWLGDRQRLTLP